MDDPGPHIPLFGELTRGNRFDPGLGSQFFFGLREFVARWDRPMEDVRTKIKEAARPRDPLIKSRAARHESVGSNSLRAKTLSRFWSRQWTTSLAAFYEDFAPFSSLSLTDL
jgi:hypothetical protein